MYDERDSFDNVRIYRYEIYYGILAHEKDCHYNNIDWNLITLRKTGRKSIITYLLVAYTIPQPVLLGYNGFFPCAL